MFHRTASALALAIGLTTLFVQSAQAQNCGFTNVSGGVQGWNVNIPGLVSASVVHDFGAGPRLFVGGTFSFAGGTPANNIAAWDGTSWETLGLGVSGAVFALTIFDDGNGPQLYVAGDHASAGGQFSDANGNPLRHLARWNGSQWSGLPGGAPGDRVSALGVHDSGNGPELYASGQFLAIGGQPFTRIAKWNGASWAALGSGLESGSVRSFASFDNGDGPMMWISGNLFTVGGINVRRIARWSGTQWLDGHAGNTGSAATGDLIVHQGSLYVGSGNFSSAPFSCVGLNWGKVLRLQGTTWTCLGGGFDDFVLALASFDDGTGPALYAGGKFDGYGWDHNYNQEMQRVARWNGFQWEAIAPGSTQSLFNGVHHLHGVHLGSIGHLVVGGFFDVWFGQPVNGIATWGCSPQALQLLPGCQGNPSTLNALGGPAVLGQTFSLDVTTQAFSEGFAAYYLGLNGVNASGCGLWLPGMGELLLAVTPTSLRVGIAPLTASASSLSLAVPNTPTLAGAELYFQTIALGLWLPGTPLEFSNGLLARIQP